MVATVTLRVDSLPNGKNNEANHAATMSRLGLPRAFRRSCSYWHGCLLISDRHSAAHLNRLQW